MPENYRSSDGVSRMKSDSIQYEISCWKAFGVQRFYSQSKQAVLWKVANCTWDHSEILKEVYVLTFHTSFQGYNYMYTDVNSDLALESGAYNIISNNHSTLIQT